ncbi:MAG: selenium-dependent molybdenum cofactor biosynthesis protein YqeB [Cellulosilyticaceae bacterium]
MKQLIVIKGAGDLATGIAYRLRKSGMDVVMTEIDTPTVVRHTVAFASAVYEGEACVEGVTAVRCDSIEEVYRVLEKKQIPVMIDKEAKVIERINPDVVVDAIIAKRNLGTRKTDAPIVIGVGPGFVASEDCHYVVETKRGHYLGRVIEEGSAIPNTGVPGEIGGYTTERIIRAPKEGVFIPKVQIGTFVKKGEVIAYVDEEPVVANIEGIVRGMLKKAMNVPRGFKCGDIDPRCEETHCYTISDKARSIGGGVLEAILRGGCKDD